MVSLCVSWNELQLPHFLSLPSHNLWTSYLIWLHITSVVEWSLLNNIIRTTLVQSRSDRQFSSTCKKCIIVRNHKSFYWLSIYHHLFVYWQIIYPKSHLGSCGIVARESFTAKWEGGSVTCWPKGLWESISRICRSIENGTVLEIRTSAIITSIWIPKYSSKYSKQGGNVHCAVYGTS